MSQTSPPHRGQRLGLLVTLILPMSFHQFKTAFPVYHFYGAIVVKHQIAFLQYL